MTGKQVVVASRSFGKAQPEGAEMLLRAGFSLKYLPGERSAHEELAAFMMEAETIAVIAGAEPITGEMINASPNLRIITMHGAGLNHIDSDTAGRRGIVVKAVAGGNSEAVADLTWGLILAVSRKICTADSETRKGNWGKYFGYSVDHKTLGIIGFGFIGKAVARRALGFDMNVLAYDVFQDKETAEKLNVTFVDKQTILTTSDIVTLHIPLLPQTKHFIGEDELDLMKSTAILVNVSRGEIVHEAALITALVEEKILGAGLDVFTEEPLPAGHLLTLASNTVLTPHIGARTFETMRDIGIACAKNILSVVSDN